ncbi:ABC transporter permease DevC [Calothrix sp. PCC 6303]|uniref:ABC transporter permease DevC n=1 Tax=Calothrix sp. PCC 6303 TaxID=1170562 RepID=UPI0002A0570A|nr:ABC transporter permease DevC [Calothrix sp. PCC 6303]AFZ00126.1 DevC protein [Calothrix sp. PCC 6303]
MIRKIPLAWLQLTRERTRLIVALAGIAFADILLFMQLGFQDSLYYSNVRFHTSLQADIVLISNQSNSLISMKSFSQRRLFQALDIKEVDSVHSIYVDITSWKNPTTGSTRNIFVMGFNPERNIFNLPGVAENLDKIKLADVILYDRSSRLEFGPIATDFTQGKIVTAEVRRRKVKVGGLFTLGASFGADGNILTSDTNFLRIFNNNRQPGLIEVGVVQLKPGSNVLQVKEVLEKYLSDEIRVFTKQEYIDFERDFWAKNTAIGFIFTLGAIMGFIVGTVIVYQILYTEVTDHLGEYATLKAIGYTHRYLLNVIVQESFILAILGYIPGFGSALFLYQKAREATLLPIFMTFERAIIVLILTILMCFLSGTIAVRKLQAADPADIF